jgi:hypothetical protein
VKAIRVKDRVDVPKPCQNVQDKHLNTASILNQVIDRLKAPSDINTTSTANSTIKTIVVVSDFVDLMNDKRKKGGGNLSKKDDVVLIRHRVLRFHEQKCSNAKQTNKGDKSKQRQVQSPAAARIQKCKKLAPDRPSLASAGQKEPPQLVGNPG